MTVAHREYSLASSPLTVLALSSVLGSLSSGSSCHKRLGRMAPEAAPPGIPGSGGGGSRLPPVPALSVGSATC